MLYKQTHSKNKKPAPHREPVFCSGVEKGDVYRNVVENIATTFRAASCGGRTQGESCVDLRQGRVTWQKEIRFFRGVTMAL